MDEAGITPDTSRRVVVTCDVEECVYNYYGRCIKPNLKLSGRKPSKLECESYIPGWIW